MNWPIWALYRAKFAKVCIRSRTKTIFAGKQFGKKETRSFPEMYENNHSLFMQMSSLNEHFPESPWVSHFMVYSYHTTCFQSSVYTRWNLENVRLHCNDPFPTTEWRKQVISRSWHLFLRFISKTRVFFLYMSSTSVLKLSTKKQPL